MVQLSTIEWYAPITADATSVLIYGSGFCPDGFGTATGFGGTGWVVDPATVFLPAYDLKFSGGTTSGSDLRPTAAGITPAAGTTYFATDSALGGGLAESKRYYNTVTEKIMVYTGSTWIVQKTR